MRPPPPPTTLAGENVGRKEPAKPQDQLLQNHTEDGKHTQYLGSVLLRVGPQACGELLQSVPQRGVILVLLEALRVTVKAVFQPLRHERHLRSVASSGGKQ